MYKSNKPTSNNNDHTYCYDYELEEDRTPRPYVSPLSLGLGIPSRKDNPIIYMEFATAGGRTLANGSISAPKILGRLYFELRKDLVPVAVQNFVALIQGYIGYGKDGVHYHYKGTRVHRIIKNLVFRCYFSI